MPPHGMGCQYSCPMNYMSPSYIPRAINTTFLVFHMYIYVINLFSFTLFLSKICFTFSLLLAVFFGSYIQKLTLGMVLWMYAFPLLPGYAPRQQYFLCFVKIIWYILACFCFSSQLNLSIGSFTIIHVVVGMMSSVGMP